MTEEVTIPLPLQIEQEIQGKQQELSDAIYPLAREALQLMIGIIESGEFKRIEEIMNTIPVTQPVTQQIRNFYTATHQAGYDINQTFPSREVESPPQS